MTDAAVKTAPSSESLAPPILESITPTNKPNPDLVLTILRKASKTTPSTVGTDFSDDPAGGKPVAVDLWLYDQNDTNPNAWITPGHKKRAHTDVTATEETDDRVKESVHEKIKKRVETLTEETTTKVTSVKVEFKLTNNATKFNVRSALGKLLEQMKQVDRHVVLKSTSDDSEWNTAEEMPIGEELMNHVVLRNENNPTRGNIISVFTKVKSSQTIGQIKFHQNMYNCLSTNKIYLRPDRYKTEKPGLQDSSLSFTQD